MYLGSLAPESVFLITMKSLVVSINPSLVGKSLVSALTYLSIDLFPPDLFHSQVELRKDI